MASRPRSEAQLPRASQFLTDSFQRGLAHWNRERLQPAFPTADWQKLLERDMRMERLEGGFIEELRAEVIAEAAAVPTDAAGFVATGSTRVQHRGALDRAPGDPPVQASAAT